MSLTALVFWVSYVGGVCAAVFSPIVGVCLYIIVYHLNPETQWWGTSLQGMGLRTSFTVALATAVGIAIRRPQMEDGQRQFPLPYVLALGFFLVTWASLAWGMYAQPIGYYKVEKLLKLLIFLMILIRCVRTPLHYHAVILAWIIGVFYLGYQAWGGVGGFVGGRLTDGLGGPDFAESSNLAVHLVATLPLIGALFFMARTWFGRLFMLVTGALAVDLLVKTRTRNAIVGLGALTASCVFALPRGYRLRGIVAVVVGMALAFHLTDPGWWTRMQTITEYEEDPSATGRLAYWHAGLEMVLDYPLGIGVGNFQTAVVDYVPELSIIRSAHNTVIECMAEMGWVGVLLFVGIFVAVIWRINVVRRMAVELPDFVDVGVYRLQSRFHLSWHATALRASLLGYMACGMFTTRTWGEDYWILIGLGLCLYNVAVGMTSEYETEVETPGEIVPGMPEPGFMRPPVTASAST